MASFEIKKDQVPLWIGANGKLVLKTTVPNGNLPLTPGSNPILDASFIIDAGADISFGGTGTVQLGISGSTSARLTPLWKDQFAAAAHLVDEFGLLPSLTSDNVLLAFQTGAEAYAAADSSFRYSVLSASSKLKAGVDASYTYIRAFPRTMNIAPMLAEHFGGMRLPGQMDASPAPGEVIAIEYGGYLRLGASASAGYQIKGTKSIELRDLNLSEHYTLGVVGTLAVEARLAGRYSIEVRRGLDREWARLTVRRTRPKEFAIAGDLKVDATLKSEGLPRSGKEFLGALLGVNGKNWLNLIDSAAGNAGKIESVNALKSRLDDLASVFFDKYAGKAIDSLLPDERLPFLGRLNDVLESYHKLDDRAVALFDRFYDPVLNRVDELASHLESLAQMDSWDKLKGEVNPMLWNAVRQLTGGDPLGWIAGKVPGTDIDSLPELRKRASDALALIRDGSHEEIRRIIHLAKSEFGLERLFGMIGSAGTPASLRSVLTSAGKGFVKRLVGQSVDALGDRELKKIFETLKAVSSGREKFWNEFDNKLEQAARQKLSLAIMAGYSAADQHSKLIDLEVRLQKDGQPLLAGQQLLRDAANGDFAPLLAQFQPEVVRMRDGLLTQRISQASTLNINIAGWHRNYQYSAASRVITNSEQQIRTTPAGGVTVFTEIDMTVGSERRRRTTRSEEVMHTNFVLRYLGETRGAIEGDTFDERDKNYAIEVITGQEARYQCTFTDDKTTPEELQEYLAFARVLGLDKAGATAEALAPMVRRDGDNFGPVEAEYAVQFNKTGLKKLLAAPATDAQLRTILRRIIVANYIGRGNIASVAALYASDRVRELYDEHQSSFVQTELILGTAIAKREIVPEAVIPGLRFPSVSNDRPTRVLVAGLLNIEREMIEAFRELRDVLTSNTPISLTEFENRMRRFGSVLSRFDKRDLGDNTVFAVIDGLIALSTPSLEARSSSMEFSFSADGQTRKLLFLLQAREAAKAA